METLIAKIMQLTLNVLMTYVHVSSFTQMNIKEIKFTYYRHTFCFVPNYQFTCRQYVYFTLPNQFEFLESYTANIYCQFTAVLLSKGGTVPPMTVHCQWRYDYRHFLVTIQLMTVGITLSSCNWLSCKNLYEAPLMIVIGL